MSDEKQKPNCYFFQTTTNPYAKRIKAILDEAEQHPVPPFRIGDMLRALADQIDPPRPKWPQRVIMHIRYKLFGVS